MSDYRRVVIETYRTTGESSRHPIRARPVAGQSFPALMKVECSASMREAHPVGTKFLVWAKVKDTVDAPHLYSSWQWSYEVLTDAQAKVFIAGGEWRTGKNRPD